MINKINSFQLILIFIATAALGVAISYSKLYLFHLALVVVLLQFSWQTLKQKKIRLPKSKTHYFFYIIIAWYFASLLWTADRLYGVQYLCYVLMGTLTSLIIIYSANTVERVQKIFKVLSVIFIIEIIVSLLESYTAFRYPISPYSRLSHFFGRPDMLVFVSGGDPLVEKYFSTIPTGFRDQQNNLALMMLMIFPFFIFHKNNFVKFMGAIATSLIIFNTTSRGVFGCLVGAIMLYLLIYNKKRAVVSLIAIAVISPLLYFSYHYFPSQLTYRIRDAILVTKTYLQPSISSDKSISPRQVLMRNGLESIKKKYILGSGAGGSIQVQKEKANTDGVLSMHNFWLEIAVDTGIPFTIFILLCYFSIAIKLYRLSFRGHFPYLSQSCSLGLLCFFPGAICLSSTIYFLPMWILLGFSVAIINLPKERSVVKIAS